MSQNFMAKQVALLCCGGLVFLQGCSSAITSERFTEKTKKTEVSGLIYHMPKRSIRLDVTIADPPTSDKAAVGSPSTATSNVTNAVSYGTATKPGAGGNSNQPGSSCPIGTKYCEITKYKKDQRGIKSNWASNVTEINITDPAKDKGSTKLLTITLVNNWATETYADDESFALHYNKNAFGQNDFSIGVNNFGLLSLGHSDTIGKADQIASNIAIDVASIGMGAGASILSATNNNPSTPLAINGKVAAGVYTAPPSNAVSYKVNENDLNGCPDGTYTINIDPTKPSEMNQNLCGLQIYAKELFKGQAYAVDPKLHWYQVPKQINRLVNEIFNTQYDTGLPFYSSYNSWPGIYYREDLPYQVRVLPPSKNTNKSGNYISSFCKDVTKLSSPANHDDKAVHDECLKLANLQHNLFDGFTTIIAACKTLSDNRKNQSIVYDSAYNDCKTIKNMAAPSSQPTTNFLALSPNASSTYFAPIAETMFADNSSDVTLSNGIITGMSEAADSELYVLSKIPMDILANSTSAVGQIFSALGNNAKTENDYLKNMNNLYVLPSNPVSKCMKALNAYGLIAQQTTDTVAATAAQNAIAGVCGN